MEVLIREFQPGEEKEIKKIGLMAFKSIEGLFITKAKTAKVAVVDGKIVGAMQYKMISYGEKSFCYLEFAFVHPAYHGKGIGNQLYHETIEAVRAQGCEVITALVKGDNIGSFGLIEKSGLKRCSFFELVRILGVRGALTMFFKTEQNIASGMDLYSTNVKEKTGSGKELGAYLFFNALILFLAVWNQGGQIFTYVASAMSVLLFTALIGSIICFISKRSWHFRMNNCGLFITILVSLLGGVFPLIGRWYPDEYSMDQSAKKELCISAMIEWLGLIIAGSVIHALSPGGLYWRIVRMVIGCMLIYRLIPTYPFSEFGANRVWSYNKLLYVVMFATTLFLLGYVF